MVGLQAGASHEILQETTIDSGATSGNNLVVFIWMAWMQVAAMDRVMAECEGMLANARQQERAAAADRAAAAAERAGAARAAATALTAASARRSLPANALKVGFDASLCYRHGYA